MLYVNTNFAIDHFVSKITWITVLRKYFVACEVRVNLNYSTMDNRKTIIHDSTEVHFTLFYNLVPRVFSLSNMAVSQRFGHPRVLGIPIPKTLIASTLPKLFQTGQKSGLSRIYG